MLHLSIHSDHSSKLANDFYSYFSGYQKVRIKYLCGQARHMPKMQFPLISEKKKESHKSIKKSNQNYFPEIHYVNSLYLFRLNC